MEKNLKNNQSGVSIFLGVIIGLFGVLYAILGTLSLAGTLTGVLPGHESEEIILIVLSYAISVLAIICCIACLTKKTGVSRITGLIFGIIGLFSLIYMQIAQGSFSTFDCVAMVLGFEIYSLQIKLK